MAKTAILSDRAILRISGADARKLMQGLITNNIEKVSSETCIFAALLTPQGKFLHDFFIFEDKGDLMLEMRAGGLPDLLKRLKMYRLRADVTFCDESDGWQVLVEYGAGSSHMAGAIDKISAGYQSTDARLANIGYRSWLPTNAKAEETGSGEDYQDWLVQLGIPTGGADVIENKTLMLEAGYDELQAIDFRKGCYVGQEITARSKYRANIRKRLLQVLADAPLPQEGVITCNDKHAGDLRSVSGNQAIAFVRLEYLDNPNLKVNGLPVRIVKPDWVVIPEKKDD